MAAAWAVLFCGGGGGWRLPCAAPVSHRYAWWAAACRILTRYLSNFVEDGQSVKAFVRSTDTWFRQHMRAAEKTSR